MRSTMAAGQRHARSRTAEAIQPADWIATRVETASSPPPRIVRALPEDDLGPARGIGLALIAGTCIWGGLVWGAVALVSRFF